VGKCSEERAVECAEESAFHGGELQVHHCAINVNEKYMVLFPSICHANGHRRVRPQCLRMVFVKDTRSARAWVGPRLARVAASTNATGLQLQGENVSRIEKGIPIPPKDSEPELIQLIPELNVMEVGDSVLVDYIPQLQIRVLKWEIPRSRNHCTEEQPDGKIRIWRTR
jgi:hypothetical protein